jgi:FKBP-type peptidyl-prolyl cis-trans isomerase FklB
MKIFAFILLTASLSGTVYGQEAATDTLNSNAGYAQGWQYMHNLKEDDLQLDKAAFLEGLTDAENGKASRLTDQESRKALDYMTARRALNRQAKTEQLLKDGKAYLQENASREGVITLSSGLQYRVLQQGDVNAPSPTDADIVSLRFVIRDLQNRELGRNLNDQPQQALLKTLIPGWQEALKIMKPGERWEMALSPNLAYGVNGSQNRAVKPSQTIITELELVGTVPAETVQAEQEQARKAQENKAAVVPDSQFSFSR